MLWSLNDIASGGEHRVYTFGGGQPAVPKSLRNVTNLAHSESRSPSAHAQQRATATQAHSSLAPGKAGTGALRAGARSRVRGKPGARHGAAVS